METSEKQKSVAIKPDQSILKGEKVGSLNVYISGELMKKVDILSNENIKRANIFSRLFQSLNFLVWGDV